MTTVRNGIEYLLATSNKNKPDSVSIVFCHRDENKVFKEGITSEEMLLCLISRHTHLLNKDNSESNITTLLHLKKALNSIHERRSVKMEKLNKNNDHSGNDIPVQVGSAEG